MLNTVLCDQLCVFYFYFLRQYMIIFLLAGAVLVKKEGRDIILEFNASVRGHYCEPGYAHFRKVGGGKKQTLKDSDDGTWSHL